MVLLVLGKFRQSSNLIIPSVLVCHECRVLLFVEWLYCSLSTAAWGDNSPSTPEKSSPVAEKLSPPDSPLSPEPKTLEPEEEAPPSPVPSPVTTTTPIVNGNGTHKPTPPQENNNKNVEELYDIPVGK